MFKDELIIIRHARSLNNIHQSENLDDGISDFGKLQAKNVAEFFAQEMDLTGFQFFTSPFLRCLQTSDVISSRCGMNPIIMPQLREYLNHGKRAVEVINRKGLFPRMNWDSFPDELDVYNEEFNETFLHRMHEAYHFLPSKSVVCTHGLPALVLLHVATENVRSVPVWDHSIDNCSITVIRKGRVIWHGRNLYHEHEYNSKFFHHDFDGVVNRNKK